MAKTNQGPRPIRLDQFKEQLEDAGLSGLQPLEIGKGEYVNIRLGITVDDSAEHKEFLKAVEEAGEEDDQREAALIVLGALDDRDQAEADLEKVTAAGYTPGLLMVAWATATREQQETLGKIKSRRS
jgi:nucleotide-binding universal stress UspA family protein